MSNSVIQRFTQSFDPNALVTNSFTVTAPSNLPIKDLSKIKAYLVSGTWDDYGTVGNFSCPFKSGSVCTQNSIVLIASGSNQLNGNVTNVVASNCSVDLSIEWVYQGDDCPEGHIRCETIKYPGYCCIPCKEIVQRINNLAARI